MKIYTRTGDDGTTGLFGGTRIGKDDPRLECYGTIDELNATLGFAAAVTTEHLIGFTGRVKAVQNELLVIGSHLGTAPGSDAVQKLPPFDGSATQRLEHEIDIAEATLKPLHTFILPGGSGPGAVLHMARTVCRRAERQLVRLHGPYDPAILAYLNRLSDWLFVHARWVNQKLKVADIEWKK